MAWLPFRLVQTPLQVPVLSGILLWCSTCDISKMWATGVMEDLLKTIHYISSSTNWPVVVKPYMFPERRGYNWTSWTGFINTSPVLAEQWDSHAFLCRHYGPSEAFCWFTIHGQCDGIFCGGKRCSLRFFRIHGQYLFTHSIILGPHVLFCTRGIQFYLLYFNDYFFPLFVHILRAVSCRGNRLWVHILTS